MTHKEAKNTRTFDEIGQSIIEYRGYRIEAIFDEDYNRWEVDAFDHEAQEYVLSPCVKVSDYDEALEIAMDRIDRKLDILKDRDKDIIIENSLGNYDTTIR